VAKASSKKTAKKPVAEKGKGKIPAPPPVPVAIAKPAAKKTHFVESAPAKSAKKPVAAVLPPVRVKPARAPEPVIIVPQLPAVPTDGKPRKNQAGLTPKELEFYRDMILAKRREIVGDMSSMEREALRASGGTNLSNLPLHMADMGTDNYEQEFTLGLMEKDRKLLRDLNDALAKIQNGAYGICEGTGKPITKARLEAQPWARYSIEWARKLEGRLR
jgi:RNA polymerase-binding protein DksA